MKLKRSGFLGGVNRFRLMLTLGLAVVLPAAALIYINFSQLRAFERDKVLEASIHRDFQELLAITEKTINKKALGMTEDARNLFPSPDANEDEKASKLDLILAQSPWLSHLFLFDEQGFIFRTQPHLWDDKFVRKEQEQLVEYYHSWFEKQGKMMTEEIRKKRGAVSFASAGQAQYGDVFI